MLARALRSSCLLQLHASAWRAKTTTGLVGLEVLDNGREELMAASRRILSAVQSIPEDAVYRRNLEKIYSHRLHVCEQSESVEQVEATLQEGQIEELVKIANDEENLIPVMKRVLHLLLPSLSCS
jgi:NADH dehydrogenase (ubiquinone) 1 alpha subcomplex subunit 5